MPLAIPPTPSTPQEAELIPDFLGDETDGSGWDIPEVGPDGFTFIWDSWEDKFMIPDFSTALIHTENVSRSADWMNILDVFQAVNGVHSDISKFLLFYRDVQSDPQIFQSLKKQQALTSPAETFGETSQTQDSDPGYEVPEGLECAICGQQITIQFQNCSHAACKICTEQLWRSKIQHPRQFPDWFSCPLCRREITQLGVLSLEEQFLGFGDEVQHGDVKFTIWSWQLVRRWMALNYKDVAFGLKALRMNEERFFAIRLETTLDVFIEAVTATRGFRPVKLLDRVPGWAYFIIVSFITLGIEGRHRHRVR